MASIKKANLNLVTKIITSLVMYISYCPNHFFAAKNVLYMAKTIISLLITYNKSEITIQNNLATKPITYLDHCSNHLFTIKNVLYVV